jgi:hypothetical protein
MSVWEACKNDVQSMRNCGLLQSRMPEGGLDGDRDAAQVGMHSSGKNYDCCVVQTPQSGCWSALLEISN